MPNPSSTSDREILQERTFDAPRELVWKAWTDPKHVDQWWGPNGFRNATSSMDFRVGGTWRFVMHGPDGKDWVNWIRYEEISKPERLVYSHGGGESDEPVFHVTVTFTAVGNRTKVLMRSLFPSAETVVEVKKFGAVEGGAQTLARLAGFLPHLADGTALQSMVLTRLLNAPAKLVFEAWSSPTMLAKWWGPKSFTLPTCEMDFRPGGTYRMVMQDPQGGTYPFHGTYREIVPNQRIVFDAIIDHLQESKVLTTVVEFSEENGKTLLTVTQSIPADPTASAGQREGWSGSLDKLSVVLGA
jgi:uncharacterized protein YndB with AHSA1/START domain